MFKFFQNHAVNCKKTKKYVSHWQKNGHLALFKVWLPSGRVQDSGVKDGNPEPTFRVQSLDSFSSLSYESLHEKTNNLGFRPGPTQTSLYGHKKARSLKLWIYVEEERKQRC